MNDLSRLVGIATLLVHLAVGCCSGCASRCESNFGLFPVHGDISLVEQVPQCGWCDSHHETHRCEVAKCSFVSPRRTARGPLVPPQRASFVGALPDGPLNHVASGSQQHSPTTGSLLLPVRLHLAYQVLLI